MKSSQIPHETKTISNPTNETTEAGAESENTPDELHKAADTLTAKLESAGVEVHDRSGLDEFLKSERLFAAPMEEGGPEEELMRFINADFGDAGTVRRLHEVGAKDSLRELLSVNFRQSELRSRIQKELHGKSMRFEESYSTCSIENPGETADRLLENPDLVVDQGYNWNVIMAEGEPFVMKFARTGREYRSYKDTERFKMVCGYLDDYLPEQAVFTHENGDVFIFQEKLDLDEFRPIRETGTLPDELVESLQNGEHAGENQTAFAGFVDGVSQLSENEGRLLDMMGDNVFYDVVDGRLIIKIIDVGCFPVGKEYGQKNVARMEKYLEYLETEKNRLVTDVNADSRP